MIRLRPFGASLALLAILVLFVFPSVIYADRGGFSPMKGVERVSESGQKAIIAWNGTHEILILSTDVSSSQESEVVELMPLPSNPTISRGEKQSFLKITELVNTYLAVTGPTYIFASSYSFGGGGTHVPRIAITFKEIIGIHYLTVVEAEEVHDLIWWLENFLVEEGYNAKLPSNLEDLFSYYIQNGMNFFVIDMIKTNTATKTVDALVYEFRSPNLYYPLRVSTLFSGDTDISLFTITSNELNDKSIFGQKFVKKAQFQIKQEALAEISTNLTNLFSSNPYLCYFKFKGTLESFDGDILADFQSDPDIPTVALVSISLGSGLVLLLLIFPMNAISVFSRKNAHCSITRRLEAASLLAGLIGVFFAWSGFFLPWGLVEFGKSREVLIALNGNYETRVLVGEDTTGNYLFILSLFAVVALYAYLLLSQGNSKVASVLLAAGGVCIMLQILLWMWSIPPWPGTSYAYYPAYDKINVGVGTTLIGCSFIILAGLLSLWRIKLVPTDITTAITKTHFKTYIIRIARISIVTLIGISLVIFWLYYILPWKVQLWF